MPTRWGSLPTGELEFDIVGPLVPADELFTTAADPIGASKDFLEAHAKADVGNRATQADQVKPGGEWAEADQALKQLIRSSRQVDLDQLLGSSNLSRAGDRPSGSSVEHRISSLGLSQWP